MRIALAQVNPTIGDFSGNAAKIIQWSKSAADQGAQLVIFPEMAICGYPPADLLEKPSFIADAQDKVAEIAEATASRDITILCGCPTPAPTDSGKRVMNSAVVLSGGRTEFTQSKMLLPYYDVFDEQRYFAPAAAQSIFELKSQRIAITICEDAWNDKSFWPERRYPVDPIENLMRLGAGLVLNISASPYSRGKRQVRREMLSAIARRYGVPVVMVNQVGGNDSLIFDGSSLVMNAEGNCIARARSFEEDLLLVDLPKDLKGPLIPGFPDAEEDAGVYQALVLGTRDYVQKCEFSKAIVGLSGGIDSALVAAIAVEALGKENVLGIGMPSEYSSPGSIDDAHRLAQNLGIQWELLPIHCIFQSNLEVLREPFRGCPTDITEENLQSRIRGTLLMALSNKLSALVLTTGNKSEMSTGYCTLYGDMVGALAVIGDVYKTCVYRLARYANRKREVIPESTILKEPSAELRPGQRDSDTLPPYDLLDSILEAYVERYESPEAIAAASNGTASLELVRSVVGMVERSEYKRQQAAPVLKVTAKSFGFGRRFPIAAAIQT